MILRALPACLALLLAMPAGMAASAPAAPLDLSLPAVRRPLAAAPAPTPATAASASRLARDIAAAAQDGWIERGVAGSRDAVLECNKGDYPGGGMGLMSLPFGRPSAQTDHCRRY